MLTLSLTICNSCKCESMSNRQLPTFNDEIFRFQQCVTTPSHLTKRWRIGTRLSTVKTQYCRAATPTRRTAIAKTVPWRARVLKTCQECKDTCSNGHQTRSKHGTEDGSICMTIDWCIGKRFGYLQCCNAS